ncbi:hypothetical protein ACMGDH_07090 [Sphingomonas sp. DT-207]|uniref:hypothetical protein n=1 Tax=Sphingomonas sp. DT-207 TaxID=3396167 RepID=UPI003F1DBE3D
MIQDHHAPARPRSALLLGTLLAAATGFTAASAQPAQPIDREALVRRHNPQFTAVDPHAPVMLGNGNLGFTADITGLQTFPERYSELAPLLTMAQWAWHSLPNPKGYTEKDGLVNVAVPGRGEQPYAYMKSWDAAEQKPAFTWLRANPHRISLARIAFTIDGKAPDFARIAAPRQTLDMWTGTLESRFTYDGQPIRVVTRVLPKPDAVFVDVQSPLVAAGRLGVTVRYPGVDPKINPDPSRWDGGGTTTILSRRPNRIHLRRALDATQYWSALASNGVLAEHGTGIAARASGGDRLTVMASFDRSAAPVSLPAADAAASSVTDHWRRFWTSGGAIDFTGSTDPRAKELERRVVLSQYLSAVNGAGELPPQEEGLFSNSWYGKFHLEMHPWHSAWQPLWGRPELLERSLPWYLAHLPKAREEAARHKVKGAWWPKMVGPEGRNSPSLVSPFLMWQQPHPILLAELVWRAREDRATLDRYGELVEATAELLASWPLDAGGRKNLGPPLIPAQENYDPMTTVNPTFEVEYFRWGLTTAQAWRERRGLARRADWDAALARIAPPAVRDGLYLPVESIPDFWTTAQSAECRGNAAAEHCKNRDHPSFLMAYGFIRGERIDPVTMRRTLDAMEANWDLRQTWGWDFPMIAMAAARLGQPEKAVDWLFADRKNNQWGRTGMTPRVHLDEHANELVPVSGGAGGVKMASNSDGAGYRRAAETYFPSNGALLMAVGMMAAGWDGATGHAPGFPKQGWTVRVEGINPAP